MTGWSSLPLPDAQSWPIIELGAAGGLALVFVFAIPRWLAVLRGLRRTMADPLTYPPPELPGRATVRSRGALNAGISFAWRCVMTAFLFGCLAWLFFGPEHSEDAARKWAALAVLVTAVQPLAASITKLPEPMGADYDDTDYPFFLKGRWLAVSSAVGGLAIAAFEFLVGF